MRTRPRNPPKRLIPTRCRGERRRNPPTLGGGGCQFVHTLPAAGEEGTLKRRFAALGPRLRLKTGTLDNVRALAGYWQARDGRRLALVAIVNSPRAPALLPALDAVVVDIVRRFDAQAGGR